MRLLAVSDLHVGFRQNLSAVREISPHPEDWLIVAGDVAEHESSIVESLSLLSERFAKVIWVPGNHELWTTAPSDLRGQFKYERLVERCRAIGVVTPEDPYPVFRGDGVPHVVAPTFTLYDYSFADDGVSPREAVGFAADAGVMCADEAFLHPDPFESRPDWCAARCAQTEQRLERAVGEHSLPLVIVNHFPLKRELAALPLVPRFKIWCGTRRTEDWAVRFGASVVVSGHLHIRSTRWVAGVRYEEVSLGYPARQWNVGRGLLPYVRQILPYPAARPSAEH